MKKELDRADGCCGGAAVIDGVSHDLDRIIMLLVRFTTMIPEENIEKSCGHMELSQLLEESIEYIGDVDPTLLRGNLLLGLKQEEATELGPLREWFFFVCREIFNPESALFAASQMTIEGFPKSR
ncbi:hypothetical protein CQW23_28922 [Capsicum baccatum]|uniref:HECT-type E3 ubiquitin transferase n=1 Tax=Capsicum baccatum TaxID=33114 RepID=A0A2G2VHX0_CAPBA|nr:hypothetical protein CQW23_28922 [Capsicum baccatum]